MSQIAILVPLNQKFRITFKLYPFLKFLIPVPSQVNGGFMQLELRIQNAALAEAFRGYVERRLRFSLSRFGGRVGRVVVRVASPGRVHSMTETVCNIWIRLVPFGTVTVKETSADLFAAIDRAVGRAERSVAHRLGARSGVKAGRATVQAK